MWLTKSIAKLDPYVLLLVGISSFLRLINLGYSDYQGGEIEAFFLPSAGTKSVIEFLLNQRKGPNQYILAYLLKHVTPGYQNEFLMRLPFAVMGVLSVLFFYGLIQYHFGKKIAFYSACFLATNGFFVAFSRIFQYQTGVILFAILCLYFLTVAVYLDRFRIWGLYLGLMSWAISILFHYDGVFIAPFAFYLLYRWWKQSALPQRVKIKHFVLAGAMSALMLMVFYVPFVLSLSQDTLGYWNQRITTDLGKISSSQYLFKVYQPIGALQIYAVLFAFGTVYFLLGTTKLKLSLVRSIFDRSTDVDPFGFLFLALWFLLPFLFMEVYVTTPGTHIFTYLLPARVFLGGGLKWIEDLLSRAFAGKNLLLGRSIFGVSTGLVVAFLFLESWTVFVDHSIEYPWGSKPFLIWTLPQPNWAYDVSLYGFPYYRDWDGIRSFVKQHPDIKAYVTNEREKIPLFYLPIAASTYDAGFYIQIARPQSRVEGELDSKITYWTQKYPPVSVYKQDSIELARIYIMPSGSVAEIKGKGY